MNEVPPHTLRILIADDHAVVRHGLKQILAQLPNAVVVNEAETGPEVLEKCQKEGIDLILLDIDLPGKHGWDVLQDVRRIHPTIKIIMLTIYPED